MRNVVDIIDDIKETQGKISSLSTKLEENEKLLKIFLEKNMTLIVEKLFENMTDEEIDLVKKDREVRNRGGYFISERFDPENDPFSILSYEVNPENTNQIRLSVEDHMRAQYLGITGCRIPTIKKTVWIELSDLKDVPDYVPLKNDIEGIFSQKKEGSSILRRSRRNR